MAKDHDTPSASKHEHHSHDHAHPHDHSHHDHEHDHGHGHDWHSEAYVESWINRDAAREDERRPRIRRMIALAPFARDAEITVLDVGAGYGFVTEEVLRAFPKARVTLQDYSEVMLGHARQRLAKSAAQLRYVVCDLNDPAWPQQVGGPFDLIVSAIAIHNLGSTKAIAACYRGIAQLLKPDATLLDYDMFQQYGGIEAHIGLMLEAGMTRVSRAWNQERHAIIVGRGKRALPA